MAPRATAKKLPPSRRASTACVHAVESDPRSTMNGTMRPKDPSECLHGQLSPVRLSAPHRTPWAADALAAPSHAKH